MYPQRRWSWVRASAIEPGTLTVALEVPQRFRHPASEERYLVYAEPTGWKPGDEFDLYHARLRGQSAWLGTYRVLPPRPGWAWDLRGVRHG